MSARDAHRRALPGARRARGGGRGRTRGLVLISSLLLLLVVTIIAMSMFRSFGLEQMIAGNVRQKQRALAAAESAQQYAEWWLSQGNATTGTTCSAGLAASPSNITGQVCSNVLTSVAANGNVANLPWQVSGTDVCVSYTPPGMVISTSGGAGTYYAPPCFYISYLGSSASGPGNLYQIDAVGYGGNPSAVAVVESTYLVSSNVSNLGASP